MNGKNIKEKLAEYFTIHRTVLKEIFAVSKVRTVFIFVLSVIIPLSGILELKLFEYLTDSIAYADFGDRGVYPTVLITVTVFLGIVLMFRILNFIFDLVSSRFSKTVSTIKQKELLCRLSAISYECFEDSDFYKSIWVANDAPNAYATSIAHICAVINLVTALAVYSVMLARINVIFVLFIIAAFLLNLLSGRKRLRKWDAYYQNNVVPEQRKCSYFENILSNRINHQMIQTGRLLPFFTKRYEKHADNERKYTLKMNLISFATEFSASLLFLAVIFCTLIFVANGIVNGRYTIGRFTLITSVMFQLFNLFRSLIQYIFTEKQYVRTIKTYMMIMNSYIEPDRADRSDSSAISLKDLSYRYRQAQINALNNITQSFKMGEKIAIVGANGSGKTTLMLIILNLLRVKDGAFASSVRHITAILQDFQYYQMTIRENIELGRGGAHMDDGEIEAILQKVDLYDFVKNLPMGINTQIGQLEDGVLLSKGQMQRLCIARMLADTAADVWILDEPTAFLDPMAEIDMYEYILSLAENRLVFFISHRMGFAKKADRIIVFDKGAICESGSHDELMRIPDGLYQKMYTAQREWYYGEGKEKICSARSQDG